MPKEKRISVRLSSEAAQKCEEAKKAGYSISDFINCVIVGSQIQGCTSKRELLKCVCEIETLLERLSDTEVRDLIREELNTICRF